ncbi:LexA family transcriptional regulator [Rhizobium sp. CC-YZS058]|uniref:XRE family transcriptional regulator n=1 Tax=Rhizobium sp. CC-YZS058 TaxID=3042153 RepID=UPI002B059030|nr:LexA family transcriptional regulator [Rhizobium sp. CC-YZS058]MEA3533686.1 LexA family transcriptional regulator [Rhizobium sp. CC-YZS058]
MLIEMAIDGQNTVAERAKAVRTEKGLGQQAIADLLGISLRGWQKIERGEGTPSGETLLQFQTLGINPGWVLTGIGPKHLGDAANEPEPLKVDAKIVQQLVDTIEEVAEATARRPRVPPPRSEPRPPKTLRWFADNYVSAGGGYVPPSETRGEGLELDEFADRVLGMRPEDMLMFKILGDSMYPTLASGDTVVANTRRREVFDDTLYVVSINGTMLVKRASWGDDGSLTWQSDNSDPRYQPIRLEEDEINSAKVVGQVERMIIALPKRV